jgi:hypothetical protein
LATNTPQRETVWVTVPLGRYNARVIRTTAKSGRAQDQSTLIWVGLKSVLGATGGATVYGDVTLLSVLVKATDGISTDAAGRVSVDATRKLGGVATSDPAEIVEDLWTNAVYGAGRPLAELDADALAAISAAAAGLNGFNGRIDSTLSVWDALRAICRPIGWYPVPLGSLISFAQDAEKPTSALTLTDAEISELTLSYAWDGPDERDGFEVEYRDPGTGQPAYAIYPSDSVHPERVELFGCTSASVAADEAEGLWLRRRYRRRRVSFAAELEGHLLEIGARITLDHPQIGGELPVVIDAVRAVDELHTECQGFVYDARAYV